MKTFQVELQRLSFLAYEINADNEEEAEDMAFDMAEEDGYDREFLTISYIEQIKMEEN